MTRAVRSLTLVESDTGHALLELLGLQAGKARLQAGRASTKDEWVQEARKLELQGKAEQTQAIREAFLQQRPVPWTPWDQPHMSISLPMRISGSRATPIGRPSASRSMAGEPAGVVSAPH